MSDKTRGNEELQGKAARPSAQAAQSIPRRDVRAARSRRAKMMDGVDETVQEAAAKPTGKTAGKPMGKQTGKADAVGRPVEARKPRPNSANDATKAKAAVPKASVADPSQAQAQSRPISQPPVDNAVADTHDEDAQKPVIHVENVPASDKPSTKRTSLIKRSRVVYENDWPGIKRRYIPSHIRAALFYAICIAVLIFSGAALVQYILDTMGSEQEFTEVIEEYVEPDPIPVEEQDDTSGWPPIIDFAALQAQNPDVAGWIRIPGTTVDYPILVNSENDYYLHRNMAGAYSIAGTIFADYQNSKDLLDSHLVIYGHHMQPPTMFHDVANYANQAFFEAHRVIYIETPETTVVCKPIGMYTVPPTEYEARKVIFEDSFDYQSYFDQRMDRRDYISFDDYERSTTDRLITLITCNNTGSDRQLVECVIEQEYPTSMIPQVIATALAEKKAQSATSGNAPAPAE